MHPTEIIILCKEGLDLAVCSNIHCTILQNDQVLCDAGRSLKRGRLAQHHHTFNIKSSSNLIVHRSLKKP